MQPSQNCIDFIKVKEQLVLKAYLDEAGVPTIGYGTTMYPDGKKVKMGEVINMQKAEECLKWEVEVKNKSVAAALVNTTLNQNQYDSLVSFAYNAGVGGFLGSTLLKKIRNNPNDATMVKFDMVPHYQVKDYMRKKGLKEINTIQMEFMRWVYVDDPKTKQKKISNGLQYRRNAEWELYSKH